VRFVDTNVLLYAASKDAAETEKTSIASEILDDQYLGLSVQVLQEFYVQATRQSRLKPISHDQAIALIGSWLRYPVQEITVAIMRAAIESANRYQISYWDAAIIEAARALSCGEVLSEDLNDGQRYGGVRIRNPFRSLRKKR
jgi:predicted nucleic acid-binding protein